MIFDVTLRDEETGLTVIHTNYTVRPDMVVTPRKAESIIDRIFAGFNEVIRSGEICRPDIATIRLSLHRHDGSWTTEMTQDTASDPDALFFAWRMNVVVFLDFLSTEKVLETR
jgi:hypothetical protein